MAFGRLSRQQLTNTVSYQFGEIIVLEEEKAKREEIGEHGFVDLGQVVEGEVDGVQLVQLGKRTLRNVDDGVVAHV
jgi:hypothetical protein